MRLTAQQLAFIRTLARMGYDVRTADPNREGRRSVCFVKIHSDHSRTKVESLIAATGVGVRIDSSRSTPRLLALVTP
jgi:hypothetical protein